MPAPLLIRKLASAVRRSRLLRGVFYGPAHRVRTFVTYVGENFTDSKARYWARADEKAIRGYWESRNDASTGFLAEKLSGLNPSSILEVGCNCGNRLYGIARRLPDCKILGIDISPLAVQRGNEWLAQEKISNVLLRPGRVESLGDLPDHSFDVVFTWAILIYIKPKAIRQAISGLLRMTRRYLVLLEMNGSDPADPSGLGTYHPPGNWKRDYRRILESLGVPRQNIEMEELSTVIWNPSGGGGAMIRVAL